MRTLSKKLLKAFQLAKEKTITNVWQLLQNSIQLFEKEQYNIACFLAMTSIEELGKFVILYFLSGVDIEPFNIKIEPPDKLDPMELNKFLRHHTRKVRIAAISSLFINARADTRHGIHPISKIHKTSGVAILANSRKWMELRNACLYTDVDFVLEIAKTPQEIITKEHAYYFICMALEILADQAELDFSSLKEDDKNTRIYQFHEMALTELKKFVEKWSKSVNVDQLDFLSNPYLSRHRT